MVGFIKDWVLSVSVASLLCGVLLFIAPSGNIEKPLKLVVSVFILFVIISPFFGSKLNVAIKDLQKSIRNIKTEDIQKKTDFESYIQKTIKEEIVKEITDKLNKEGISDIKIDLEIKKAGDEYVLDWIEISSDNNVAAKKILTDYYKINESLIHIK